MTKPVVIVAVSGGCAYTTHADDVTVVTVDWDNMPDDNLDALVAQIRALPVDGIIGHERKELLTELHRNFPERITETEDE